MNPERLGKMIYEILGFQTGDNIVLSKDKMSSSVLVTREVQKS
jgi:hypothetical protein